MLTIIVQCNYDSIMCHRLNCREGVFKINNKNTVGTLLTKMNYCLSWNVPEQVLPSFSRKYPLGQEQL